VVVARRKQQQQGIASKLPANFQPSTGKTPPVTL